MDACYHVGYSSCIDYAAWAGQHIMTMNVLKWFWLVMSGIFVFVALSHKIYQYLPSLIRDLVVYGKLLDKKKRSALQRFLLVPKRWFLHFYILSFIWNGAALLVVMQCFLYGHPLPGWYSRLLSILTSYPISASAELATIMVTLTVIVLHAGRRVYECLFISVYSESNIHLSHYVTGILFYFLVGISVMAEGPDLSKKGIPQELSYLITSLKWPQVLGLALFLWASWHHHIAHVIFASLRTSRQDANRHLIPQGDWFEYVSCPHYLSEILIYLSLVVILGGCHSMAWLVLVFVVVNQTAASLEVHRWYRRKFEDYPKQRKAFIPFFL